MQGGHVCLLFFRLAIIVDDRIKINNRLSLSIGNMNGIHKGNDDDDELIESLVKTVTATPGANTRTTQRERKRTKDAHRKSRKF